MISCFSISCHASALQRTTESLEKQWEGCLGLCHVSLRGACPISARLGAHGVVGSPKGNFSFTLLFIATGARGSVGPSAYTDTVTLGVT